MLPLEMGIRGIWTGDKRNMDLDNLVLYKNPYSTVDSYLDVKNYLRKPAEWKPAIAL